jgi:3-oxoisoapionate kinase
MTGPLPDGVLVAWYGDDYTGAASVLEVLSFAGIDSVLFLDVPTAAQRARFTGCRAIGIAGSARSRSPSWMDTHLPAAYATLAEFAAPITQYKYCSTFDSTPAIGSIGRAIELALPILGGEWIPLLTAAPANHRYQAFGNLFASVDGVGYRLDRHPTMARHPVTPMHEADLGRHLAAQTTLEIGLVDFVAMKSGTADVALAAIRASGSQIVSLDVVDDESLREAGRLIWQHRGDRMFVAGSQGLEYALIAHWRAENLLPATAPPAAILPAPRVVAISGSCSPTTAQQIDWAEAHGFAAIRVGAHKAADARAWNGEIARVAAACLEALASGHDPVAFIARGPEDASLPAFRDAAAASGTGESEMNSRVASGLGRVLDRVLREGRVTRAVIAGGDTSSGAAGELGVFALTALAPAAPGAALCRAHTEDPARPTFELALKGGQMGGPDYFGRIRAGGGEP